MNEEAVLTEREQLAFSRSLFGYDPMEVRAFVAQMNEQVERLQVQQDSILSGNGAVDEASIGVVIDSVVGDIAEVLEAARGSYRKVRERAEHEAAEMLAEAAEQVRKMLATAESDCLCAQEVRLGCLHGGGGVDEGRGRHASASRRNARRWR